MEMAAPQFAKQSAFSGPKNAKRYGRTKPQRIAAFVFAEWAAFPCVQFKWMHECANWFPNGD